MSYRSVGGIAIRKVDALLEVKKAEEKVEKFREEALKIKEKLIKDSKRNALRILDEAKAKAQRIHKGKIEEVQKEIEAIKKRIIGEGQQRAKELKTKADANHENAVNLLIKKFEGEVSDAKT